MHQDKKYYLFGRDGGKKLAQEYSIDLLGQLPLVEISDNSQIQHHPILKIEFVNIADKLVDSLKALKEKKSSGIPQINIIK